MNESERLTSITATAVGVKNEFEFLQRIATGDVCFYGTTEDNKIKVPIEWNDKSKYFLRKEVERKIIINNVVYYEHYQISVSSDKEMVLFLSDNLKIEISKGKFNFDPKSKIGLLRKDAEFLNVLVRNEVMFLDDIEYRYGKVNVSDEFLQSLNFFIDLDDTLKEIHYDYEVPHQVWTTETREQMVKLVGMKKGNYNHNFTERVHIYNWKNDEKYVPIAVIRHDEDECNDLINAVITKSIRTSISDETGKLYTVPVFSFIDWNVIKKLYKYEYDFFVEQINVAEINEYTINEINHSALKLVAAYDETKDIKLLEIALYCLKKIYDLEKDKEYYLVNLFQIKKRFGTLDEDDIVLIDSWDTKETEVLFAKYVLLEKLENAKKCWAEIDDESKKFILDYPIYTLYKELLDN